MNRSSRRRNFLGWNEADVLPRSAECHSAVSPNAIRQRVANVPAPGFSTLCGLAIRDTAGWHPALQNCPIEKIQARS